MMIAPTTSGLRRAVALVLMIALMLAGAGRGVAAGLQSVDAAPSIAGIRTPICHTGAGGPSTPADPGAPHHDCCDACALLAAVVLPDAPQLSRPAPVVHFAGHARAMAWVPVLARLRSPRQSRGPPSA